VSDRTSDQSADNAVVDIFVARQPIFGASGDLMAYELLHRRNPRENWAEGNNPDAMASDVLVHAFLNIGMERMTDGHRAYLNFTREMLTSGVYQLLDPRLVVIELLETVRPDPAVIAACEALVRAGYTFALDDFVFDDAFRPMLELASIVKVDVLDRSDDDLRGVVAQLSEFEASLLAERVETTEVRQRCGALGFELFQGYFFARPEILTKRELSTDQLTIMRLMNVLRDPTSSDLVIEEAFRADVSLSYKLLRTVNSAARGGRGIESIGHAIRLTGRNELHKWMALLLLSSVSVHGGVDAERARVAVQRARFCELLEVAAGRPRASAPSFMTGLFSLLDAILMTPMTDLLDRLDLAPEVRDALLQRSGPLQDALSLAEAYEQGSWEEVSSRATRMGVPVEDVPSLYVQSLGWARDRVAGDDR
jgi:EAL and modified HD-GYP domain-containing signal transduction protein